MISIDKLSEFVFKMIADERSGLFCPQNDEYVCTCQMIREIALAQGKRIKLLSILNPFITVLKHCTQKGKKAFGDLIYTADFKM